MKKFFCYKIKSRILTGILMILIPVIALCLMEGYTHVPWDLTLPIFLLNLTGYYLIYLLGTFIFGGVAGGYTFATLLFMCCGLANYCVVSFRSSPIVPWDIYSVRTAVSVADNYHLDISGRLIGIVIGFLALVFISGHLSLRAKKMQIRMAGMVLSVVCLFGYVEAMGNDTVIDSAGLDTTLFTPNVLYRNNGLLGGFVGNIRYLKVEKPEGYSAKAVEKIAQNYHTAETVTEKQDLPNIIVIMNEAFSDLSVFGDFSVSEDYMPFIHSLDKNVLKGHAYVSVKGGNTANSEFEFLTGDSMAFMPTGSVPYQQYIKSEIPSLASRLNELGYTTTAIHPYYGTGWCRNIVYPLLGFDQLIFKDEFVSPKKIRNYISDESAFQKIIDLYEEKDADEKLFTFEVTMQNHGGYSKDTDDFSESVYLTDETSQGTQVRAAEKYLTLIQKSDEAFKNLVEYFEKQQEPTIILMFGDHQPSDYITNVILRELGLNRDESDDVYYNNYIVPYIMWSNYDMNTTPVEDISLNYLGGMLMEKAGIGLTGYQQYLKDMQKEFPVITANMVMDANKNRMAETDAQSEWIENYQKLVYNHLCDKTGKLTDFFE